MDTRNVKTEATKYVYRTPNFVTEVPTLVVIISDVFVAEGLPNASSAATKSWLSEIRNILLGNDVVKTGNRAPGILKAEL